ncbi:MAG TPA: (d)CMP kinase [Anaerolineaceae bacterium]|nr:MAG: cytidylate kinase [Chloroflexi bacterium GWB2_54_36]HAL15290.1 (d)CMP kinase [Anaerolineaceae bacterium]HBA91546.1 (d)CMP kinase [Anaerolineaceae bacterium]
MVKPSIIAIDGPAASGKSTLGERLAQRIGYLFFDTGILYRAVTWAALQKLGRVDQEDEVSALSEEVNIDVRPPSITDGRSADVCINGVDITWDIRSSDVDANVSQVSAYPRVRQAMTRLQRRIGQRGGVVMVGRDIGTVVFPEAELKIYLVATVEERARRRYHELTARGEIAEYDQILASLRWRDAYDSGRKLAPLRPAEDAIILDSEGLTIEQVVERALELIEKA